MRAEQCCTSDILQISDGCAHANSNILEWRFCCGGGLSRSDKAILPFNHVKQNSACYCRADINCKDGFILNQGCRHKLEPQQLSDEINNRTPALDHGRQSGHINSSE